MPKSFIQAVRNRKLHLLYGTAVGVLLSIGATERVLAACVVTPGPGFSDGADVGNCTGASGFIDASGGNDIVTLHQAGNASDIAVGSDGTAWIIGAEAAGGNAGILRWTGGNWARVDGAAQSIAVR